MRRALPSPPPQKVGKDEANRDAPGEIGPGQGSSNRSDMSLLGDIVKSFVTPISLAKLAMGSAG